MLTEDQAAEDTGTLLKLLDTRPGETGQVSSDDYVPISLTFASGAGGTATVIAKNGDGSTLVDIGIDLSSGRITRAALVGESSDVRLLDPELLRLPSRAGLPMFDTGIFPSGALTSNVEWHTSIHIERNGEVILVRLTDAAPDRRLTCGDAHFLLSGDDLVGFGGILPSKRDDFSLGFVDKGSPEVD